MSVKDTLEHVGEEVVDAVEKVPGAAAIPDAIDSAVEGVKNADNVEQAAVGAFSGVLTGTAEGFVDPVHDALQHVPGEAGAEDALNAAINTNDVTKAVANVATDPFGAAGQAAVSGAEAVGLGDARLTKDAKAVVGDLSDVTDDFDLEQALEDEFGARAAGTDHVKDALEAEIGEHATSVVTGGIKGQQRAPEDDEQRLEDAWARYSAVGDVRYDRATFAQLYTGDSRDQMDAIIAAGRAGGPGPRDDKVMGDVARLTGSRVAFRDPSTSQQAEHLHQHRIPNKQRTRGRHHPLFAPVALDRDAPTFADRLDRWVRPGGVRGGEWVDGGKAHVGPPEAIGYIVYPVAQAHLYEGYVVSY